VTKRFKALQLALELYRAASLFDAHAKSGLFQVFQFHLPNAVSPRTFRSGDEARQLANRIARQALARYDAETVYEQEQALSS
jgi:hypothetical protein